MKSKFNFNPSDIAALQRLVGDADRIVLVCHVAPDGDAMGSTLGMWHILKAMGKRPAVITPDVPTHTLSFLPGAREVMPVTRYTDRAMVHIQAADLIICLDFNALMRIDKMQPMIEASQAPKVLIDHHLGPEEFADVIISRPQSSSTCYLLYEVIREAGWECFMSREAAECLYCGMMTDTGNFSFNSNDPELYIDIARLLGHGINKDYIYKMACDTRTVDQLRLNAYALDRNLTVYPAHRAAVITLDQDELKMFNYKKGDTEGLVNQPLSVPDIVYSIFLRQDNPEFVKVSMRSKGDFPVNLMCEKYFGGGGHKNAAGGEQHCSLAEVLVKLEKVMADFDQYLPVK